MAQCARLRNKHVWPQILQPPSLSPRIFFKSPFLQKYDTCILSYCLLKSHILLQIPSHQPCCLLTISLPAQARSSCQQHNLKPMPPTPKHAGPMQCPPTFLAVLASQMLPAHAPATPLLCLTSLPSPAFLIVFSLSWTHWPAHLPYSCPPFLLLWS